MLKDEATVWLPYFFDDSWKGVEQNPKVERVLIDDSRIFVWLDQPERVDREIDRFVKSLSSAIDQKNRPLPREEERAAPLREEAELSAASSGR